jgi:hypothetical protein
MNPTLHIDGDFPSGVGNCIFHCCPTCHPAQVGLETVYGCTHPCHPANKAHDFVPIVGCKGNQDNCEMGKYLKYYRRGLKVRLSNCRKKASKYIDKIVETNILLRGIKQPTNQSN